MIEEEKHIKVLIMWDYNPFSFFYITSFFFLFYNTWRRRKTFWFPNVSRHCLVKVKATDQSGEEGGEGEQTIKAKLTSGVNISLFIKIPTQAFCYILPTSTNIDKSKFWAKNKPFSCCVLCPFLAPLFKILESFLIFVSFVKFDI